jgi:4-hydroxy-3-methylbut-2-enyl diphosphate reductase
MEVIRAEALGMCFGVKDALAVLDGIERPEVVTIRGELVHNPVVLGRLDARGFRRQAEADRAALPATEGVLITAHGVSDAERSRLEAAGKRITDTTCPLVLRVHRAARALEEQGYHVLVIGKRDHVEVRGIVEDLARFDVLESPEQARRFGAKRLGIVCQTTTPARTVEAIRAAIAERNPDAEEIRFVDTVCRPTKQRQRALEALLERVEAVVVVGGRNSNNTRELVTLCRERGVPALHVEGPEDLEPGWFSGLSAIGLTAGTSSLDETIDAVEARLRRIGAGGPRAGREVGGRL